MSVEIVGKIKDQSSVLSQELQMKDVFRVTSGCVEYYVVLQSDENKLALFDLDYIGNAWDFDKVVTVGDAVESLSGVNVKSIEYFRQPGIDVKVTVGDSVKVF